MANQNQKEIEANGDAEHQKEHKPSAYERLSHDLTNDQRCLKEITLGKRIGFYRIRGELGSGNFSQVKMGIHALTKGKLIIYFILCVWVIDQVSWCINQCDPSDVRGVSAKLFTSFNNARHIDITFLNNNGCGS